MRIQTNDLLEVVTIGLMMCAVGCGGSTCGNSLATPLVGPGGLTVALSGIGNGSAVPCSGLSSGETCNFTAGFTVSQLTQASRRSACGRDMHGRRWGLLLQREPGPISRLHPARPGSLNAW